jgi:hypothetical protein
MRTLTPLLILITLTACAAPAPAPPTFPVPAPPPIPTPLPSATSYPTVPPEIAARFGDSLACAANSLRLPLRYSDGAPVRIASQIETLAGWLLVIADGSLYRMDRAEALAGHSTLKPLLMRGQITEGVPMQELTALSADPALSLAYALDKAGHVWQIDPASGAIHLRYRATPDQDPDPNRPAIQFTALTVDESGRVLVIEGSYGRLLAIHEDGTLETISTDRGLLAASAIASNREAFFTLQQNNSLRQWTGQPDWQVWRSASEGLGLSLFRSDHTGARLIYAVDAIHRQVDGYLPGGPQVAVHRLAFSQAGLLRDAVFADGKLMALLGSDLILAPAGKDQNAACAGIALPDAPPTLDGVEVIAALKGLIPPIEGASLPEQMRLVPGAARVYRMGVHQGMDFYGYQAGWPVRAALAGQVIAASLNYQPLLAAEFEALVARAVSVGYTEPDSLARFEGRVVALAHGGGLVTRYAHLQSLAPGIVPGAQVEAGQTIGAVGVSGTQAEGQPGAAAPHLHFEIWINGHPLGEGIGLRETMWWFEQVMGEVTP